jgi:DNA-binding response OmpR family regulator
MFKIMLVEDEIKIRNLVSTYLGKWQYEVIAVTDFSAVLKEFTQHAPHLVLLDVNLPQFDGFYWCQKIRELSKVPILFTSSRTGQMDVLMGINLGADDYLYKPYDLEILLAKVNAMIRRTYAYHDLSLDLIEHEGAVLNLKDFSLSTAQAQAALTKNEFLILKALLEKKGQILSRETLMRLLWEDESFVDDNTLTVNINRLRKKLESIGLPEWIQTKKKQGYWIG